MIIKDQTAVTVSHVKAGGAGEVSEVSDERKSERTQYNSHITQRSARRSILKQLNCFYFFQEHQDFLRFKEQLTT